VQETPEKAPPKTRHFSLPHRPPPERLLSVAPSLPCSASVMSPLEYAPPASPGSSQDSSPGCRTGECLRPERAPWRVACRGYHRWGSDLTPPQSGPPPHRAGCLQSRPTRRAFQASVVISERAGWAGWGTESKQVSIVSDKSLGRVAGHVEGYSIQRKDGQTRKHTHTPPIRRRTLWSSCSMVSM